MSTEQIWQIESTSLDDTLALTEQIGSKLKGGEVIELVSDLGGGKTTFTKGLVKGTGSKDAVHSPSFTISNQYMAGDLAIYHFDFYRLKEAGIMRDELAEAVANDRAVVIVEWASIVEDVLPNDKVRITIQTTGEQSRKFQIEYPEKFQYLIQNNT